jgi:hypothetical protein
MWTIHTLIYSQSWQADTQLNAFGGKQYSNYSKRYCTAAFYTPGSSTISFAVVHEVVMRLLPVLCNPGHAPVLRSMLRNTSTPPLLLVP